MSVASKNPFDLLGDSGDESPAPAAKPAAAPALAAQQPKVVPGAAPKGGRGAPRAPRPNVGRPNTQDAPIEGTENAGGFDGERVPPPKKHHHGPDAHTKGPRENRRGDFTSGGHKSRGSGAVRGGRTPAQGGERRQYERRPASGAQDSQKKVEQGWGADEGKAELTAEVAGEIDAQADQKVATPAEDAEEGAAAADEEAEPETKTLDQYLAEQAEKTLAGLGKKDGRQVTSETLEGKAFVREAIDDFFTGKQKASAPKEKAAKKEKVYIEVDGQFAQPAGRPQREERGDRPQRGGARGGFAGRGRGGPRGGASAGAPRASAPRANGGARTAPIDANDQKAFPALGA